MKYCQSCGAQMVDSAQFCSACGSPQPASDTAETHRDFFDSPQKNVETSDYGAEKGGYQPQPAQPAPEQPKNKFMGKASAFEQKHNLFANLAMLICAIVVMLVALLVPIKVEAYDTNLNYITTKGDKTITTPCTVNQSIYQIVGSIFYFNADEEAMAEIQDEYRELSAKALEELSDWGENHPNATDEELENKRIEIVSKYLSGLNYFGMQFMALDVENLFDGTYSTALLTVILGWVIAVFAIIMAIMSLVQLIIAIVNMAKKSPQKNLYKYFSTILGLSTVGLSLMCFAPMFKASGSMLAIAITIALAFLACGTVGSLAKGTNPKLVIKHAVIAALSIIGYFVLFTEVFAVMNDDANTQVNAVNGYGMYSFLSVFKIAANSENVDVANLIASTIMGFFMYLLVAGFLVSFANKVVKGSLQRLASGNQAKKSSYLSMALTSAIFGIVIILLGYLSALLTAQFFSLVSMTKITIAVRWVCRPGIWVCAIVMLAAYIFGKVFIPDDQIKSEQPQQPEHEQAEEDPFADHI